MSIIVTGMEMPENCWNCPFCGMSLYDEKATWSCTAYECRIIAITSIRQEWCPLRPERKAGQWIPFQTRPLDEEEKEEHPEWDCIIDCKLPDHGQRILVNIGYKGHEAVQIDEYYDDDGCYLDSGYEIGTEATAWMPLPEPYQEGGESDAEYITKDAVLSLFEKWSDGYAYIEIPVQDAMKQVSAIPPADVRPVRRGRWIVRETAYGDTEARCSECGFTTLINEPGNGLHMLSDLNYCPDCGCYNGCDADGDEKD